MEEKKQYPIGVDYHKVFSQIWSRRKLFWKTLPIAFVLSCIWILPQPRFYTSEVMLAPEAAGEVSGGSLANLASSFGFNISEGTGDAIYPMLYPDLFESPEFIVSLFDIKLDVPTDDGEVLHTDYYTYMLKHQKKNWLTYPFQQGFRAVKQFIKPKKDSERAAGDVSQLDPFHLSYDDYTLVQEIQKIISCSVDKKTDVTTIVVVDQNAVVSAVMADSVKSRLQRFIIDYRTSKARLDLAYYERLSDEAKAEYEQSVKEYSRFCDANRNSVLQSYLSHRDELENDMQLKFQTYTAMNTQLQGARAKVQEKTPAFTTLKTATVPVKPAGPKRMIFVAAMLFLTFIGTSIYIVRDILLPHSEA